MTFPGVSQPESNDYFPPVAKSRIAFEHVFFDLFSIIVFWYARKMRRVILYNLREKSASNLIFWWSYGNFSPVVSTLNFPSTLLLGRVVNFFHSPFLVGLFECVYTQLYPDRSRSIPTPLGATPLSRLRATLLSELSECHTCTGTSTKFNLEFSTKFSMLVTRVTWKY